MPLLIDPPAPYPTKSNTMTPAAAVVEARRILEQISTIDEALSAMIPDGDSPRLSPSAQADLRAMRFHANEAESAWQHDDWPSARRHLLAVLDRWSTLREYPEIAVIVADMEDM